MQEPLHERVFVKALPETIIRLSEETPEYIMGLSTDNLRIFICVILIGKTKRISLLQPSFNTDIRQYIKEEMKWLNGIDNIYLIRNTYYEAFYLGDAEQCEHHNQQFFTQLQAALVENQLNLKPIQLYTNTGVFIMQVTLHF